MTRVVEVLSVKMARDALDAASLYGYPTLLVGDAGVGKTTALKHLRDTKGAAYWEVNQHTKEGKGLYISVLHAFGIYTDKSFKFDLGQQCLRHIGADRPLLVDEFQNIVPTMQRELLMLHEQCGFPLVLAGNRHAIAARKARERDVVEQIQSRIGMHFVLDKPTPQDCRAIAVEFNVEGVEAYAAVEAYGCRRTLRELVKLLKICSVAANGCGIGLRHIECAVRGGMRAQYIGAF